ncbi:MAG: multicopper oxidase domain-containing protein [Terriglobales bacterium]
MKRSMAALVVCVSAVVCAFAQKPAAPATQNKPAAAHVRTYFLAAEEVEWNYAPRGNDGMMDIDFTSYSKAFTEHSANRIGTVYRKAVFHEYTDDTFKTQKPRPAELAHMGLLGPVIRAEVGDTIKVVFLNRTAFPFSIHPHGVAYNRDSEGAMYADGMEHPEANGLVPAGKQHTYTWEVRPEAGPGPNEGSSKVWLYHSHNFEPKDVNAGLIGPIVITRKGMARADGSPKDIAHEVFALFMIIDENQSQYLDANVKAHIDDPSKINHADYVPLDPEGNGDLSLGTGYAAANMKSTINGYMFSNNPLITMRKGEHVRWYVMTMGIGFNFHTPHWHGNVVKYKGEYLDVLPTIGPAQALTADMIPDRVGTWMFHCHVDDHMKAGMQTVYEVTDALPRKTAAATASGR